jgi:hypothetical protein
MKIALYSLIASQVSSRDSRPESKHLEDLISHQVKDEMVKEPSPSHATVPCFLHQGGKEPPQVAIPVTYFGKEECSEH